jgi:hypothetical protein
MKEMKSFLGVANYFRDHIKNHSVIVQPLNAMLVNYNKKALLQWTAEAEKALEDIKSALNKCPMLFFPDETGEIHVYTDASDIGMGAYMCQIRADGKEYPIAMMSRTFTSVQKRWSVPEREGYAIYEAIKKFDYLLRDVRFILHTDHENLVYKRDSGLARVQF